MTTVSLSMTALLVGVAVAGTASEHDPIKIHPRNPRYFEFRGKPTVLISSAEHYGAVINLDFDHAAYLEELKANQLNVTRLWVGGYVEGPESFRIENNTLAPRPGRFIAPWARSTTPGYARGGNKFDLTKWDPAYFERLKSYVLEAGKRGVIVEVVLFCTFYEDHMWALSPWNAANNINGIGKLTKEAIYPPRDRLLKNVQEAMVRKIVTELNPFDNVYYEICNEPYERGYVSLAWQHGVADLVVATERTLPHRHLIAQGVGHKAGTAKGVHPAVSILNFHAATAAAVADNHHLAKIVADDETGGNDTTDERYRVEGWDFILAGGAVYNHLDFSFTPDDERGGGQVPAGTPGGGSRELRRQLRVLIDFINGFDFVSLAPDATVVKAGVPDDMTARALSRRGEAYAVYLRPKKVGRERAPGAGAEERRVELKLDLPAGRYRAEWVETRRGGSKRTEVIEHHGGERALASPPFVVDIALAINKV